MALNEKITETVAVGLAAFGKSRLMTHFAMQNKSEIISDAATTLANVIDRFNSASDLEEAQKVLEWTQHFGFISESKTRDAAELVKDATSAMYLHLKQ